MRAMRSAAPLRRRDPWHVACCEASPNEPRLKPGFPYRTIFHFLTCLPWKWVLVAPSPTAPTGLVNVETGESHPVVW
jgi:hypothetical protein